MLQIALWFDNKEKFHHHHIDYVIDYILLLTIRTISYCLSSQAGRPPALPCALIQPYILYYSIYYVIYVAHSHLFILTNSKNEDFEECKSPHKRIIESFLLLLTILTLCQAGNPPIDNNNKDADGLPEVVSVIIGNKLFFTCNLIINSFLLNHLAIARYKLFLIQSTRRYKFP